MLVCYCYSIYYMLVCYYYSIYYMLVCYCYILHRFQYAHLPST